LSKTFDTSLIKCLWSWWRWK